MEILDLLLNVAFSLLLVHVILSWLINFQVLNLGQPVVHQLWTGLNKLFEPVFQPIRRILPDTHPLDLAPLVVFIIIIILRDLI
ncbi:YggT family protein [Rhodobacteraceae bacterium 63075]|nr:YggT family protein [Rhodobacteraceae bacterium 63075]